MRNRRSFTAEENAVLDKLVDAVASDNYSFDNDHRSSWKTRANRIRRKWIEDGSFQNILDRHFRRSPKRTATPQP
jgi:hypothetical protein